MGEMTGENHVQWTSFIFVLVRVMVDLKPIPGTTILTNLGSLVTSQAVKGRELRKIITDQ